jgi:hypothetical protein
MSLSIGCSEHEHVKIIINQYEDSPTGGATDYNWLLCTVDVSFGKFTGTFSANFQSYDFIKFTQELKKLYACLKGTATFNTLEGQLEIKLTGNGNGTIELTGMCMDSVGVGNQLSFSTELDQTYLPSSIAELEDILNGFQARAL